MLATLLSGMMVVAATACGDGKADDAPQQSNAAPDTAAKPPVSVANIDKMPMATIDTTRPSSKMPPAPAVDQAVPIRTPDGEPARYAMKSGRLTFRYDGDLRGERVVTFDDYGLKEYTEDRFTQFPMNAMSDIRDGISIATPTERFSLEAQTKTAYKLPNIAMQNYLASDSASKMSLTDYILARSQAKRIKEENLQGYATTMYEIASPGGPVRWWYWKGIVIREEGEYTQMNKHHTVMLQKIELNIPVPESLFQIPAGYKIQTPPPPPSPNPPSGAPGAPAAPQK
ncbi:MAG: hypothetical protein IT211_08165 [Armatimonadetes bacterium]|nr:hypothetical protein [Armatimonadota bacterium]